MKKKRESGTMKKLIKKIAIAILTGTIAFSVVPATVQAAGWKQNKNGYWWQENDYSYPRNQWKTIYGKQYHFNSSGYMDTGWQKIDGYDYYFGGANDGSLKTNIWVNGYYVDDSGRWTGQECYTYSNGEYLSEVSISHNRGEYSYLGFWHSYHCRIYAFNSQIYIEDTGSKNHTYVNQEQVTRPHVLRNNDVIRIGDTRLTVKF